MKSHTSFLLAVCLLSLCAASAPVAPPVTTLRGFHFYPQFNEDDPGFPWLSHYAEYRPKVLAQLQELRDKTDINFIDFIVVIPWTLAHPPKAPLPGQPLDQWANIPFLNNLASFIDDCHNIGVSIEIDLANNMWIPYSVDSAHHIGKPGDPYWPVADDTPWDEAIAWYTQIIEHVEARANHPEGIAMWCMFGNYQHGGAEPTLWDCEAKPYTEQFVKKVWPAFRAAGSRPKAAPIMLPIFAKGYPAHSRLSAFSNLKKWIVDDLQLPPDYWVMTTYPFCDPAPDGVNYLAQIIGILGKGNACRLISTDFKAQGDELDDCLVSCQGNSAADILKWHLHKCTQYGLAGWWVYTYQDTPTRAWGIRDFSGNWKEDQVKVIRGN